MSGTMSTAQANVLVNSEEFLENAVRATAEKLQELAKEEDEGKGFCTICRERATLADWPIHLPTCNHIFCMDCIGGWARNSNKCPNCRAILYESPPPPPVSNTDNNAAVAVAVATALAGTTDNDDVVLRWDTFADGEWVNGMFVPSYPGPIGWPDDSPGTQAEGVWDHVGD
ncbi:uncharacterized protein K452DRAFT_346492 [Aplosporella prunicola CBS 121167]|uniref:RING-type domain-containing protein n=1 Tax=Aplosporella prunicola CBS 121167 TaxID=1176127 RepID=A0A6A6BIL4_9PEZI|nr:uncharacterized protein K452DRAFT_346492 [Aplosporella prunicola CBS 121167]KAF2143856.1 hypothetical protein K452DRAFT_346492 [Aplosporella prunicola CBS 121167]